MSRGAAAVAAICCIAVGVACPHILVGVWWARDPNSNAAGGTNRSVASSHVD